MRLAQICNVCIAEDDKRGLGRKKILFWILNDYLILFDWLNSIGD